MIKACCLLIPVLAFSGVVHARDVTTVTADPLRKLIGVWEGDKGIDVAPAQKAAGLPAGSLATSPFYERIVITEGATATNASEQDLVSVSYRQQVFRKSDRKQFHDQIGYWIWDRKQNTVIHSFCIPRGVCTTAEGKLTHQGVFSVATQGPFAESEFMKKNGKTQGFSMELKLNPDGTLAYTQKTDVKIYGKDFIHVDSSVLKRKQDS